MNRRIHRVISLLLCMLFVLGWNPVAGGSSVSALEILGTDDDITGYIIPDNDSENSQRAVKLPIAIEPGLPAYTEIFSITAGEVHNLLVSNKGGKSFSLGELPTTADTIKCAVTLHHSLVDELYLDSECVQAGVCYYGYNYMYGENTYIAVFTMYISEEQYGKEQVDTFAISDVLEYNETYYSYVKNFYPSGYIYGTVVLYHN